MFDNAIEKKGNEIKLATVFSGIGAIEHALDRMNLNHKIIFACDNGDVDVLSKKIPQDIEQIEIELSSLEHQISEISSSSNENSIYKEELNIMLNQTKQKFVCIEGIIKKFPSIQIKDGIISFLRKIVSMDSLKTNKLKKYNTKINLINSSNRNIVIDSFQTTLEILNEFKKDNSFDDLKNNVEYKSKDGFRWNEIKEDLLGLYKYFEKNEGKKILKDITDLSQRTSMLHEKINSYKHLEALSNIKDYSEKKKYVDALYSGKEKNNRVKQTYMANYKLPEEDFHWNVSFLDGNQYTNKVDLFVGGSPCQSFSLVGKQRGLADTRGTLFYEYARLVKEIKPKVFIYENVKALLSNDEGKTWETIQNVFTDLQYTWSAKILNAKDYGIPQNRERVFVVGFRSDLVLNKPFSFPKPVRLDKTMQDFLLDNVSGRYYLPSKGVDFVTKDKNLVKKFTQIDGTISLCQTKNQQFNWHGDFVFEEENADKEKTKEELEKYFLSEKVRKYVLSPGTKNFYAKPKTDLKIARPLLTTMHKMHRAGVDNYVTTDGRLRKLTPRECFRLMGFCDTFEIPVSDLHAYQQAGNSIVVDVLINIMDSILESYPNLGD